jgi:hypothetical protein
MNPVRIATFGGLALACGVGCSVPIKGSIRRSTAIRRLSEGRKIFRYETFGSEAFWGGQVQLHPARSRASARRNRPGLSPRHALQLGLKVDVAAVPKPLRRLFARAKGGFYVPGSRRRRRTLRYREAAWRCRPQVTLHLAVAYPPLPNPH